ncbi:MAG: sugar ABC transporter permease [Chloroflexi bacterium]|nr:sugar ABC transporter permease [Chloroflexota bacterium]
MDSTWRSNTALTVWTVAPISYAWKLRLLLAPFLIGGTLLVLMPVFVTLGLAFTQYDVFSPPRWNDYANFHNLFSDLRFKRALYNSLWFGAIAVPLRVAGAFLLALALNRSGRAFEIARATIYLPTIIPEVAYALVWLLILNPGFGPLNLALNAIGLPGVAWLQEPLTARGAVVVMWLFQLGEGFVLMLAMLQTIPRELFESAALDGANRVQIFRRIVLPLMVPALFLLSFRDTALSFQGTFVPGLITTETGPYYATFFLPHYIVDESFGLFRYGYGAAATIILYLVTAMYIGMQSLLADPE